MLSEIPSHPQKAIQALEVKLALAKGEKPALKHYQQLVAWYDQQSAIELLNAMPRSFYCKLSARQTQVITNQADTFGLPISPGSMINVPRVLQWFHSYVSEWGPKVRANKLERDRVSELAEKKIEAEIEAINTKLIAMQLDVEKKRGSAVPIAEVRQAFAWLAGEWRKFGERLGKKFGADSQRLLNDFLERLEIDAKNHVPGGDMDDADHQPGEGDK